MHNSEKHVGICIAVHISFCCLGCCLAPTANAQTAKAKNGRRRSRRSAFFVLQTPALLQTCQWLMWTSGWVVAGEGRWVIAGMPIKSLDGENSWTSSTICSVFPLEISNMLHHARHAFSRKSFTVSLHRSACTHTLILQVLSLNHTHMHAPRQTPGQVLRFPAVQATSSGQFDPRRGSPTPSGTEGVVRLSSSDPAVCASGRGGGDEEGEMERGWGETQGRAGESMKSVQGYEMWPAFLQQLH